MPSDSKKSIPKPLVIVLTTSFPRWPGDHEGSFVWELTRRLARHSAITVIAPHIAGAAAEELFGDVQVVRFRYAPAAWEQLCYGAGMMANAKAFPARLFLLPGFLLAQLLATYRVARASGANLLHAHWFIPSGLIACLVNVLTDVPVLVTAHGSDVMKLSGGLWGMLQRWIMRRSRFVTVVSQAIKRRIDAQVGIELSKKISVIPMGVDTTVFHPAVSPQPLEGDPAVLFVGWLDTNKGFEYLLRAVKRLIAAYPGIVAHAIGTGPEQGRFEQEIQELRLTQYVRFHGLVRFADMPGYYRGTTVFVLPSLSEGVPVSVLEAMASGCPIVASRVGGIPDAIEHEREGLLVSPGDPAALAAALRRTIEEPKETSVRLIRARERVVAQFDWRIISTRFEKYYKSGYDA